jgi:RND superfamily putative drug exporter
LDSPEATKAIQDYETKLRKLPGVQTVQSIVDLPMAVRKVQEPTLVSGNSTVISVNYTGGTMDTATQDVVRAVRKVQAPDAEVKTGGQSAILVDVLDVLAKYIPIAASIIGVTLFVLLFLMLGSIVIPLNAIIQNVLSLSTSFGALVLLFQDKHFADLLHLNAGGSIDATQPVLIFAAAFGLSMDYAVFLYSRIKEEHDRTNDNTESVLVGLQKSGPIITSAAILLFVVVVAFATGRISVMQQVGVGLAVAILVDAFIVRMVLVPATMRLFGQVNWWAPAFLKRLHQKIGLRD